MKVLLTHGYFLNDDPKEMEIMKPYVPLGILYIAGYLEREKIQTEVFDSTFKSYDLQLKFINKYQPNVIGLYTNLMTKVNVIRLVKALKADENTKHIKLILGGPDLTYNQVDYLNTGVDALVIGEGELTFTQLVNHWDKNPNQKPENIDGISFLNIKNEMVKNKPRQKVKELSELTLPARHKVNMRLYLDTWKKHHGSSSMTLSTQRGCPYTCKWCSTAVYGQSYRRRNPQEVIDEMVFLNQEYQPDHFWFVDDVFTVSHKWLKEFADLILEQGVKVQFECISRADRMSEEVLSLLQKAGCFRVWIGAESGSQKIIDAMDRRVDVNIVREMIQLAQTFSIEAGTFIMIGYPGETIDDINETIHHLKVSNPSSYTITKAYPIKGTRLFDDVEETMIYNFDWQTSTDRDRDFKRTYTSKFYDYAVRYVVNEVESYKDLSSKKYYHFLKKKIKSSLSRLMMEIHK